MAESNKNDKPAEPFKMGFSLKKNTTSKVATLAKELEAQEKRDFVVSISGNQIARYALIIRSLRIFTV